MISIQKKYIIDSDGKPTSVILTKKDYDRLMEYVEELEDIASYDRAKAQGGKTSSWKDVRR